MELNCKRFYLTYEELKLGSLQTHLTQAVIDFILPMRNWNPIFSGNWSNGANAILSYLWGIETLQKAILMMWLPYLWGIETFHTWWTMERVNLILSYLWGIETHKQVLPACWPWKFYLTYEELKHKIIDSIPGGVGDFILPMRNWNVDIWVNPKEQVKDFILPMRNWNTFQSEQIEVEKLDFILPMRNWNFGCSW